MLSKMSLFFDTETTGKAEFRQSPTHTCQPDLVQLAAVLLAYDEPKAGMICNETVIHSINCIIRPDGYIIQDEVAKIHKITQDLALRCGTPRRSALSMFRWMCEPADEIIAHNIDFDDLTMQTAFHRENVTCQRFMQARRVCTMKAATPVCKLPKPSGFKPNPKDPYKWPTLTETYQHFFGETFDGTHNALNDVFAMMKCWKKLKEAGAV